jgi:hypothetical protein
MSSKIKIYMNDPTAGGIDGDLVSSSTGLAPIESGVIKVPTDGYAEGSWLKLAVRCDEGYLTVEDTARHARVQIVDSDSIDKWQLAHDDEGSAGEPEDWGDALDFLDEIDDTNTIFWARARVADTEEPANDTSVDLVISATIGAEEIGEGEEE